MAHVSVFGLGYVGTVTAAALAAAGHDVIGIDPNPVKVESVRHGRSPVIERGLDELLERVVAEGRLTATSDPAEAVRATSISVVCVGTPSRENGSLDLSHVRNVSREIGAALPDDRFHVVVVRSTMLPGSTEGVVIADIEAASGRRRIEDFGVSFNPEFLREGSSLHDYDHPPYTLIGSEDTRTAEIVESLYTHIDADVIHAPLSVAEMVKYVSNAYHALKVSFANEIGNICAAQDIDSHAVMDIFVRDTKLNVSAAYLKPGFAFGGSCLPKDLRALTYHGRRLDVVSPVLESIMPSNQLQVERAFRMIEATGKRAVGVLGMSFKPGTDDLRESPMVELIERLIGKGFDVRVFDRNVSLAGLQGANRTYIEREIPHIATLMFESLDDLVDVSEVLVVGHKDAEFDRAVAGAGSGKAIVDLVRIATEIDDRAGYAGIAW
ncbi:MAG TPA: nucleotide sugar dehydrogenase [Acidimicrobiia bacterium]|nr:nucleotide sugar dehydrogenase [Acidimicrobiia bacterium]